MTSETMNLHLINSFTGPHEEYTNLKIAEFLLKHLDEYGDSIEDILKAIDYVFRKNEGKGDSFSWKVMIKKEFWAPLL